MLKLNFVNQSGLPDDQVFVTAYSDSPNTYDVTFQGPNGATAFDKKKSQTLKALASSLAINKLDAGRFYISFKNAWQITRDKTEPAAVDPSDAWFRTQWD